ncbi:hypothetical protein R5R35_001872 [Gryllus longicercus]|uniref:Uncharacterized protein n=1 Tax=Gryllus longicercus TaxID=2509291 RepID=A0AAN9VNB4_9ORTH
MCVPGVPQGPELCPGVAATTWSAAGARGGATVTAATAATAAAASAAAAAAHVRCHRSPAARTPLRVRVELAAARDGTPSACLGLRYASRRGAPPACRGGSPRMA